MPEDQQTTAALFATCIVDQFYPQVGVSVVRVLRRLGVDLSADGLDRIIATAQVGLAYGEPTVVGERTIIPIGAVAYGVGFGRGFGMGPVGGGTDMARELEYSGIPLKRQPVEYFQDGRLFVTCEGNEQALSYTIDRVGPAPFMFASDFPHEISMANAMEEIDEILEREDIREEHKMAILGDNARRFCHM